MRTNWPTKFKWNPIMNYYYPQVLEFYALIFPKPTEKCREINGLIVFKEEKSLFQKGRKESKLLAFKLIVKKSI